MKMKKKYVSPVMAVVDVVSAGMLAASVAAYRGNLEENGQSNSSGSWGNLWR